MHQGRGADRRHCHTAEDYCRVFAELCFTTVHWEALRKLFVDMLLHSPYVEVQYEHGISCYSGLTGSGSSFALLQLNSSAATALCSQPSLQ
jgi:hypothetical protein